RFAVECRYIIRLSACDKLIITNNDLFILHIRTGVFHVDMDGSIPGCFASFQRLSRNEKLRAVANGKHRLFFIHEMFGKLYKTLVCPQMIRRKPTLTEYRIEISRSRLTNPFVSSVGDLFLLTRNLIALVLPIRLDIMASLLKSFDRLGIFDVF